MDIIAHVDENNRLLFDASTDPKIVYAVDKLVDCIIEVCNRIGKPITKTDALELVLKNL